MEFFEIDETKIIYELNSGKYKKIKTLGEGAFGKVLLVEKLLLTKIMIIQNIISFIY